MKISPKRNPLNALFPAIREAVLRTTLHRPERWWSMSGLARLLRTRPSSLQRELALLVTLGILERRDSRNRVYFRAQVASPAYGSLRSLFEQAPKRTLSQTPPPQKSSELPAVSPILLSRYQRETLYNEVWSRPMRDVARKYGVSDVAIGKVCRKLLIPVPGLGYWAKVQAGKPVPKRPPLPTVTAMR